MSIINCLKDSFLHPDIKVGVQITASMNTGDGVFAGTDLMDLPDDGFLLINITGDNIANVVEVPQLNHHPTYTNVIPVINSGKAPALKSIPCYKIRARKGSKPVVMVTMTGSNAYALGMFFRGRNNPVGMQAPDIMVVTHETADNANLLEDTDLEDPGYPGWIYTWAGSDQVDGQIMVRQRNYKTGHYSLIPVYSSGLTVDCEDDASSKEYVRQGGEPSVTYNEVTAAACTFLSCFYVDRRINPMSLWR